MLSYIKSFISISLILVMLSALTTDSVAAPKWWEKHDEGWFFYNEKTAPAEPEESAVPTTTPSPKEEPPLATDIIKKEGDRLLSEALVNPTEDNVVGICATRRSHWICPRGWPIYGSAC